MSDETVTHIERSVAALDAARKARQRALAEKVGKKPPEFIKSIRRTEMLINIDPLMLPYSSVDAARFLKSMKDRYAVDLETPQIVKEMERVQKGRLPESYEEMLYIALQQENVSVDFRRGRYPTGKDAFVFINGLSLGRESMLANVGGLTQVAETLLAEVFEELWIAAGALQLWKSQDVQSSIQLKSFGTHTKVDLGVDLLHLFKDEVREYIQCSLKDMTPKMTSRSIHDDFSPQKNITAVLTVDDVTLNVHAFSTTTGRAETAQLRFSVTTKDELGRGIVDIISELPYDEHVVFVSGLIDSLKGQATAV